MQINCIGQYALDRNCSCRSCPASTICRRNSNGDLTLPIRAGDMYRGNIPEPKRGRKRNSGRNAKYE